jgi:arylsulfatase A-like enzyme
MLPRCVLALALLGLLTGSPTWGAEPAGPNIIFILADDLGYGDLGCYGQKQIKTPNLDGLAAEGMRFTQCYAGSTVCAPSRCTLMVGQHTGHCRVRGNALVPLQPEDVTVAEVLKEAGYTTALVGKWGLGEEGTPGIPNKQGFDYFFGYLNQRHAHNYYPDYLYRNQQKVFYKGNVVRKGVAIKKEVYSHSLLTNEALDFVKRSADRPFFLYLAYTIPHANNERGRAEGDGMEIPSDAPYSDKPWPQPQKSHAAMITLLDRDVGRLLRQLKDLKIDDNTVVFFTSDNGPHKEGGADPEFFHSAGPLRGYKRSLTEGGIRVPMLVRWPGKIKAGQVNDHIWAFWDFLPTAAELAGVKKLPGGIDGLSVVPTLLGQPGQKEHDFLYWEFHEGTSLQAVRRGEWKGIRQYMGPLRLYHLPTDIHESNDVSDIHPQEVEQILKDLASARTESKQWPLRVRGKRNPKK